MKKLSMPSLAACIKKSVDSACGNAPSRVMCKVSVLSFLFPKPRVQSLQIESACWAAAVCRLGKGSCLGIVKVQQGVYPYLKQAPLQGQYNLFYLGWGAQRQHQGGFFVGQSSHHQKEKINLQSHKTVDNIALMVIKQLRLVTVPNSTRLKCALAITLQLYFKITLKHKCHNAFHKRNHSDADPSENAGLIYYYLYQHGLTGMDAACCVVRAPEFNLALDQAMRKCFDDSTNGKALRHQLGPQRRTQTARDWFM
eukprot:104362-Pelagomonas_calceolata.AAC.1